MVKRAIAGLTAAMLTMSLFATSAFAATPATTESIIDTSKKGSITLYKIIDDEGRQVYGNGLMQEGSTKNALNTSDADLITDAHPVQGVVFKGLKIADIQDVAYADENVQTGVDRALTKDGKTHVGTFFKIVDTGFVDMANQAGYQLKPAVVVGGEKYFTTAQMELALETINGTMGETRMNKYVDEKGTAFTTTDANGKAVLGKGSTGSADDTLDLGLYLVAETDISNAVIHGQDMTVQNGSNTAKRANIMQLASAFLISVPQTNVATINGNKEGTLWQYDIYAYPKNTSTTITKKIISDKVKDTTTGADQGVGNKLIDTNDYKMGDTVRQVIFTDVPVNRQNLEGGMGATAQNGVNPGADTQEKVRNSTFIVTDYMSKGLTFENIESVKYGTGVNADDEADFNSLATLERGEVVPAKTAIATILTKAKDYCIVPNTCYTVPADSFDSNGIYNAVPTPADANGFSVVLTNNGLRKLDSLRTDGTLAVFFDCKINKDALIGTDKGADEYGSTNGGNTNHPTLVYQHTNSKLYSVEGNQPKVFTYELDLKKLGLTDSTQATFKFEETAATRGVTRTNPATFMEFVKEADGVYHVYDACLDDTINWTTLQHTKPTTYTELNPATSGLLIVKGLDSEQYTVTEVATQSQYQLLKRELDLYLVANNPETTALDGSLLAGASNTRAVIDGTTAALTDNPATGKVKLSIENLPSLKLRTGGEGNMGMYVGAAAALVLMFALIFVYSKKRRNA